MEDKAARILLAQSGFSEDQVDALMTLRTETATKLDVRDLSSKLDGVEARIRAEIVRSTAELRGEMSELRSDLLERMALQRSELIERMALQHNELSGRISAQSAELSGRISAQSAELSGRMAEQRGDVAERIAEAQTQTMRWGIAMIIAMSTIFTLLDVFID